ncbi:MAG: methyl-accepting chemotaxis protein [Thioalkalispiraceae bacterium]|jgi:methyl-accepting chemotaxis protein
MKVNTDSMTVLYKQGDKIMVGVMWFLFVMALGLSTWYDTKAEALWIGLPSVLLPTFLYMKSGGTLISRLVNAAAFMVFSALHIHQAHGMIEVHFGIFVLLAFLLFYRDWKPVVAAAAVIAVHHLSFNFLQAGNAGVYLFDSRTGIDLVLIHAAYVVFETAILVYMATLFNKEALQSVELQEIGQHLGLTDGKIDLSYRKQNAQSTFAQDFNHYVNEIDATISGTRDAADQLTSATLEMNSLSSTANDNMQRQLSETDQVATAINEMTATVQEVARSASEAATAAQSADEEATKGRTVVTETINVINNLASSVDQAANVINELNSQSDNIGVVLEVIKEIADQTNLLALNAAIEAARAGEQGRGFAVVADEVRTLASRTQQSTEEIHGMIEKLQSGARDAVQVMENGREQAHSGVEQASLAGASLQGITSAINTISEMNTQIAAAATQQSHVAEDINRNIINISQTATDAAQAVSHAASAGSVLDDLAVQLQAQVKKFVI